MPAVSNSFIRARESPSFFFLLFFVSYNRRSPQHIVLSFRIDTSRRFVSLFIYTGGSFLIRPFSLVFCRPPLRPLSPAPFPSTTPSAPPVLCSITRYRVYNFIQTRWAGEGGYTRTTAFSLQKSLPPLLLLLLFILRSPRFLHNCPALSELRGR